MSAALGIEEWRKVDGFDRYSVSNAGRVRNDAFGRVLNPWMGNRGYPMASLRRNGETKKFLVHRLVASSFLHKKESDTQVNHVDGVRHNNGVFNLEWCTSSHNIQHAHDRLPRKKILGGENHANMALSDTKKAEMFRRYANEKISQRKLAGEYGISQRTVCQVVNAKCRNNDFMSLV